MAVKTIAPGQTRVGWIGTGVMGSSMCGHLIAAGFAATVFNRTKSKAQPLLDAGMQWGETPRAVAEAAEITLSMVTNTQALESVASGPEGIIAGLSQGKIYIDMSTVSPAASRALAEQVKAAGADMLDAPVSGSVPTLEEGKLSIMAAGSREAFERALPILRAIGPKVTHVGANGLAVAIPCHRVVRKDGVLSGYRWGAERKQALLDREAQA